MQQLSNDYLIEIATQLAFLSTFLGGFSATFLATILAANFSNSKTNWVICSAAISACSFVVASVSFVMVSVTLHPSAPNNVGGEFSLNTARIVSSMSFLSGVIMLLTSVGLSGWLRSTRMGIATSSSSFLAILLVFWAMSGFG